MNLAVIGAGVAGLTLARLIAPDANVTVFEKARGVGGRMATRYADQDGLRLEFDHGVGHFSASSAEFRNFLSEAVSAGVVAHWPDETRYVGRPRMNALCQWLATDLDIRLNTRIAAVRFDKPEWILLDAKGHGQRAANGRPFDGLVLTAPAPQTAALAPAGCRIAERALSTEMRGRFTLMLGFDAGTSVPEIEGPIRSGIVSEIIVNSKKPGRPDLPSLVIHSTHTWAEAHMADSEERVRSRMLGAAADLLQSDLESLRYVELHRWRHAGSSPAGSPAQPLFELDPDSRLAACGDWLADGRVEGAWRSATELAAALSASLRQECQNRDSSTRRVHGPTLPRRLRPDSRQDVRAFNFCSIYT